MTDQSKSRDAANPSDQRRLSEESEPPHVHEPLAPLLISAVNRLLVKSGRCGSLIGTITVPAIGAAVMAHSDVAVITVGCLGVAAIAAVVIAGINKVL